MAKIEIFSSPKCGYCDRAKALLDDLGYAYKELDVAGHAGHRMELQRRLPRVRSLPQIFVGGEHIGGATELFDACREGRLQTLLEENNVPYDKSVDTDPYSLLPGWLHAR